MPALLFNEPEPKIYSGLIQAVEPGSLAAEMGLRPGDEVLAVNGHPVQDVIDVQFYAAEDEVEVEYRREGTHHVSRFTRQSGQAFGIEFTHPTFDIDIRRCNNLCPFCFVLQTAPRMRRTLYIKDDDYRYSFLYGHYVTLTNLSEHDWGRIAEQRLSPLYVSVHSTDLENRRACLANKNAPDILAQLRWLAGHGIETHTQLVITPGLNDGHWMEKSVRDLAELYPSVASVSVVPVGLTRHHKYGHRPHTVDEARHVVETVHRWQTEFRQKLGVRFVYLTDEWYLLTDIPIPPKSAYDGLALEENGLGMVRGFLEEWKRSKRETRNALAPEARRSSPKGTKRVEKRSGVKRETRTEPNHVSRFTLHGRRATLVTASLFAPTLRTITDEFNAAADTQLEVVPVLNERLGHTITVAGLLMGADVVAQLKDRALGEFVVLPRVMFDHPDGVSLDDITPMQIAQDLNCPIFLADAMGDVLDALTGRNALGFDPAQPAPGRDVMKAGGWAVEKYL
jgi:putative radical SAM enzyme (TIGR03279 family)